MSEIEIDAQRHDLCRECGQVGTRAKEQVQGSIYALYICPSGHEFEVDRIIEHRLSEVAQLRVQIEQECVAMQPRFAIGASHRAINQRYRNLGNLRVLLTQIVGEDQAVAAIGQAYVDALQEHAD